MSLSEIFLWPGSKLCKRIGVDPQSDAGLIRWMFNMIFYLVVTLTVVWIVAV